MKRTTHLLALAAALLAGGAIVVVAGPLNPPGGPVASTHKTLTEVEPRTPIGAATTPGDADSVYRIVAPGSYYLAGNVAGEAGKYGIEVDADDVTLDLRGFELLGVPGSLDGVRIVPPRSGVTVRDGSLRSWGQAAVSAVGGANARNCLFIDLRMGGNSSDANGYALDMGAGSTAVNCVANYNFGTGFRGNDGCYILGCTATNNGGDGILCGAGVVRDCLARGNVYDGIRVGGANVITGCSATYNLGAGITISYGTHAHDNACHYNAWGIWVYGDGNRVENNVFYDNGVGIEVVNEGNLIVRNSLRSNDTSDSIVPGNDVGPFESAATSTSPWANIKH